MRIAFLVNDRRALEPDQTTTLLVAGAAARDHEVFVTDVRGLGLDADGKVVARAVPVRAPTHGDRRRLVVALGSRKDARIVLDDVDVLLLRTNPARDRENAWAHSTALAVARIVRDRGVSVVNDPDAMVRAGGKLYVATLPPEFRPPTLVSRDHDDIAAFVESHDGPSVLKPLEGTHGRDVFRVEPEDRSNLRQIVDVLTRDGYAVAQPWVDGAEEGDVRVIMVGGKPLEVDGHLAAVRRVPKEGEFRSNVAAGGTPAPADPDRGLRRLLAKVGPHLAADGLFLVGLDLVGRSIVEVNAYATGGLFDAERYAGVDFSGAIVDALQALRR